MHRTFLMFMVVLFAGCGGGNNAEDGSVTSDGRVWISTEKLYTETFDSSTDRSLEFKAQVEPGQRYTLSLFNDIKSSRALKANVLDGEGNLLRNSILVSQGREQLAEFVVPENVSAINLSITSINNFLNGTFTFEMSLFPGDSAIPLAFNRADEAFVLNQRHQTRLFKFVAEPSKRYAVNVNNTAESHNTLKVQAFNSNREPVSNVWYFFDGREDAFDIDDQQGTVYISVSGLSAGGYYLFYPSILEPGTLEHDDVTLEPNNSLASAYPALVNATYTSNLSPKDQRDWYRFDLIEGDQLTLDISNAPAAHSTVLEAQLYHDDYSNASNLSYISPGYTGTISYTATADGPVYLKLTQAMVTSYSFTATIAGVLN